MKTVELLSPCKNWKSLKAAEPYADAIYFGTHVLNLRHQSDNFNVRELKDVALYCHERNIKAYLTLNSIIYDNELTVLEKTIENAKTAEIDALIVHDLSAVQFAREKEIPFHVSTQANISNSLAATFYEDLGAERVILARELSLKRIKQVVDNLTRTEAEVFVHGAMCTSISGRCYFSLDCMGSVAYSGNRGRCVQPCRRKWRVIDEEDNEFIYNGQMFLNTKDLCMIEHVPELMETGVASFKIEGRMRDPHYVEVVSKSYREAIDSFNEGTYNEEKVKGWMSELKKVFNRGFTTGFYFRRPTDEDIEHDIRGNVSHHRQIEIGYVNDYFSKQMVAKIVMTNGRLKLDYDIFFIGAGSDTYFHQEVKSMRIKGKNITETPIASKKNHVLISMKVNEPVKENDRVFFFTDKTYENFKKGKERNKRYKLY